MSTLKIVTNNVPRDIVYGYELSDKERKQFDYMSDSEIECSHFVRYQGYTYYLGEFMRCSQEDTNKVWDGVVNESWSTGVLLRFVGEKVVLASFRLVG